MDPSVQHLLGFEMDNQLLAMAPHYMHRYVDSMITVLLEEIRI
jgi:hypothetical protein